MAHARPLHRPEFDQAAARAAELQLTQVGLMEKNPKSYPAWHHRKWVAANLGVDAAAELALTGKALLADERNFHCWNYRRYIVDLCDVPATDELAFTQACIERNFSNFSAWHYRTLLLPQVLPMSAGTLADEFAFVRAALFTEPWDQSGWFYHAWLSDHVCARAVTPELPADELAALSELVLAELRTLQELQTLQPECPCMCRSAWRSWCHSLRALSCP